MQHLFRNTWLKIKGEQEHRTAGRQTAKYAPCSPPCGGSVG